VEADDMGDVYAGPARTCRLKLKPRLSAAVPFVPPDDRSSPYPPSLLLRA
jgi:hypothetical protein